MRDISDEDLHTRVVKKYQDLQKNMRKAGKLSATVTATTTAADSVENAPSSAAVITTTSRSKLQSRARGVSQSTVVTKQDLHPIETRSSCPQVRESTGGIRVRRSEVSSGFHKVIDVRAGEADCDVLDLLGGGYRP
jgi:hypothetical protein